jgi:hypothetical protein
MRPPMERLLMIGIVYVQESARLKRKAGATVGQASSLSVSI